MKKVFLTSISLLGCMAVMAQTLPTSLEQQRRGTILDPRTAGTAVLVPTSRITSRDYTQPVVIQNLAQSQVLNPAFVLMRSANNTANINNAYTTSVAGNMIIGNTAAPIGTTRNVPLASLGLVTSPSAIIPGLPVNLPTLPSVINPVLPIVVPVIAPVIPIIAPVLPVIKTPTPPVVIPPVTVPTLPTLPIKLG